MRLELDAFPGESVGSQLRGAIIPGDKHSGYDFARLERAVAALAEDYRSVLEESVVLRSELEDRSQHVRALEGQVLEANQRRQDVVKRIDDLIAQMDHLDQQLASLEESGEG